MRSLTDAVALLSNESEARTAFPKKTGVPVIQ